MVYCSRLKRTILSCYWPLLSSAAGRLNLLLLWARSCTTPGKIFCSGKLSVPAAGPTEPVPLVNMGDSLRKWPDDWEVCRSWLRKFAVVTGLWTPNWDGYWGLFGVDPVPRPDEQARPSAAVTRDEAIDVIDWPFKGWMVGTYRESSAYWGSMEMNM